MTVSLWNRNDDHVMCVVHTNERDADFDARCAIPVYVNRLSSTGLIRYGNPLRDAILNLRQALLPQLIRTVIQNTPKAKEILFGTRAVASAEPKPESLVLRQLRQFGRSRGEYPVKYKGMEFVFVPEFEEDTYRGDRHTKVMFRVSVKTFIGYDRVNELQETRIFVMSTDRIAIENNQIHLSLNVPARDVTLNSILHTIISSAIVRACIAFKETVSNAKHAHRYLGIRYDPVKKQLDMPDEDGTDLVRLSEADAVYAWLRCHGKPGMPKLWFQDAHRLGKEHWTPND